MQGLDPALKSACSLCFFYRFDNLPVNMKAKTLRGLTRSFARPLKKRLVDQLFLKLQADELEDEFLRVQEDAEWERRWKILLQQRQREENQREKEKAKKDLESFDDLICLLLLIEKEEIDIAYLKRKVISLDEKRQEAPDCARYLGKLRRTAARVLEKARKVKGGSKYRQRLRDHIADLDARLDEGEPDFPCLDYAA